LKNKRRLLVWVFQTGEPLHVDGENARPMRAMNLSNALVKAGHQVVLWSSAFHHQEKRHRTKNEMSVKISDNLEVRLIPSRGYQRHIGPGRLIDHAQMAFRLKKMLQKENSLPDVAFVGYPPIETSAVMTRWLNKRCIPSIIDVKDQWPSIFLDAVPGPLRPLGYLALWPYFFLARRAMNEATGVSAMSNGFLKWALMFIKRERTDNDGVFPLTSPQGQVSKVELEAARQWWDEHGIEYGKHPNFCFVGSLMSVFDFKPVQEAAKIAAGGPTTCQFIICGEGGSSAEIKKMMSGLPNVHFPGWIDRPKIEALAERCQGALAPYLNIENYVTNIPNKIIDALSLGLPIITPLQGEVAWLISECGVGMRYGTDTGRTLYDCIQILTQDVLLLETMAKNARALYAEKFSFEMVYGNFVKHLEGMTRSRTET